MKNEKAATEKRPQKANISRMVKTTLFVADKSYLTFPQYPTSREKKQKEKFNMWSITYLWDLNKQTPRESRWSVLKG